MARPLAGKEEPVEALPTAGHASLTGSRLDRVCKMASLG